MHHSGRKIDWDNILVVVLSISWLCCQLYFSLIRPASPIVHVPVFLAFALSITFAVKRTDKKWVRILDLIFVAASLYVGFYFYTQSDRIMSRIPRFSEMLVSDIVVSILMILLLLESVRRVIGLPLYVFVLVFIAYAFLGEYAPGFAKFSGMNLFQFIEATSMATEGVFGTPLTTVSNYIFYFLLFGTFFSACGGGKVLIDIGLKTSKRDTSGPAKAAVISSGLMGMISGSAVANVTTTGVLTIPMMKKAGYAPEEAGAVEAVASTGGQIMPPIMGVGAFIMAELLAIPYSTVCLSAVIPAIAYFGSALMLVTFLAQKRQHKSDQEALRNGTSPDESSVQFDVEPILPRLYLIIPAIVLVYYVLTGMSMRRSAMYGIVAILLINLLVRNYRNQKFWLKLKEDLLVLWRALLDGIGQCADVAIPTAACGIIICVVVQSGLASRMSGMIATIGGDNLLLALLIAMAGCMLLGMALPSVAAYLVAVTLFVPVLQQLEIPLLVSHMFVFYFGIIAQITPPVCMASFAAAGIAGADSWSTGWNGFRYATVAFLIPFVFVYQPAILLIGTPMQIVVSTFFLFAGTLALAGAIAGFFIRPLFIVPRIILFAIALLLIIPETVTSVIGILLLVSVSLFEILKKKKETAALPS